MSRNSDKRVLLWIMGGALLLAILVAVLAPKEADDDPRPTTYNTGSEGAKAAFLTLSQVGYKVERWEAPADNLDHVDAASTTLVLAEPNVGPKAEKATAAAIKRFLERGGRVLITGPADLVPEGHTGSSTVLHPELCYTYPEGNSNLAQTGQISMREGDAWNEKESKLGPALHVEQRCGKDAVVVSYAVGKGEVVWWSSALPLSNAGLHEDASLKLLLASLGEPGRTVLFDEFVHGDRTGFWDAAKGLPLKWLVVQVVLVALLLILSFSRRRGPLRMPVRLPRTSPVEFAESMGHLYQRAGATNAPTRMARRRLLRFLQSEGGIARVIIEDGSGAIAEALSERFGGDWTTLRHHLEDAAAAETANITPASALKLVQAMDDDLQRLQQILAPQRAAAAAARAQRAQTEDVPTETPELVSAGRE